MLDVFVFNKQEFFVMIFLPPLFALCVSETETIIKTTEGKYTTNEHVKGNCQNIPDCLSLT